jgi:CDP-diacylglycerol--serine O-phosphatidyltransferase
VKWSYGPIGVKDLFTLVNLVGGTLGIYYSFTGQPQLAGIAVLLGYAFGDALDGFVARLTKTSNRFGGALDSMTDHLSQAVTPAIIVFEVYREGGHLTMGFVLMTAVIAFGTIRHALFSVARIDEPLMYCGLPRTVSGYAAMSFVLSHYPFRANPWGYAIGAVLIPALALAGLLPIPYMTHRGARRMQLWAKLFGASMLVVPAIALVVWQDVMFDIVFLLTFVYAAAAWMPLYPEERRAFYQRYKVWAAEVSR